MYHYTCHGNSYISLLQEIWSIVNFLKTQCTHVIKISIWCREMTIGRISLCWYIVGKLFKSTTTCIENLLSDFSFLRTLWLENWKYCWIWLWTFSQWSILTIFLFYMEVYLNAYISSSEVNFEISTMSALWTRFIIFPL